MEMPRRSCAATVRTGFGWSRLASGLALFLLLGGCQKAPPDAVVALRDFHLTLPQVAGIFEERNGAGSFDTASVATRERFVRTLADREILLRVARREVPNLTGRQARQYRVMHEKFLYREMLNHRRTNFKLPPAAVAENVPRLQRQARVRQFAIMDMPTAQEAARAIEAGSSFEALANRFASRTGASARGGAKAGAVAPKWVERTVRVDDRRVPPPLVVDALLRDLKPGSLVGPTMTMEGYLVTQVLGYEPLPEATDSVWVDRAEHALEGLAYMNVYEVWMDSLKKSAGYGFHPEGYPIVQERFAAFWDSVDGLGRAGVRYDFQSAAAPVGGLTAERQATPLYDFYGPRTVADYLQGLDSVDLDYWPTRGSAEKINRQIEARLNRLLLRHEAFRIGLNHSEGFRALMTPVEERLRLDELYERTTRDVPPPKPEEIAAEYARLGDTLQTPELISFSALTYPPGENARIQAVRERLRSGAPLLWLELAPAEAAADTTVRYLPPTELLNTSLPPPEPGWTAYFRAARQLQAGEISEPIPATNGGLALVRVVDRRPPQRMSLEQATPPLQERLQEAARDRRVEEILRRDRKRLGLRVFADRLNGN
jgi:hypothetical protein